MEFMYGFAIDPQLWKGKILLIYILYQKWDNFCIELAKRVDFHRLTPRSLEWIWRPVSNT